MKQNADRTRRTDPEELPPGKDAPISVRFTDEEIADLDKIVRWMRLDPKLRRLKRKFGRSAAICYAIGHIIDNPPSHVGATRG